MPRNPSSNPEQVAAFMASFLLQRSQRIHAERATGGKPCCEESNNEKYGDSDCERPGIAFGNLVQQAAQPASGSKGSEQADENSERRPPHGMGKYETQNVAGRCAQSHAHSNLLCSLCHQKRNQSIKAYRGQGHTDGRKQSE